MKKLGLQAKDIRPEDLESIQDLISEFLDAAGEETAKISAEWNALFLPGPGPISGLEDFTYPELFAQVSLDSESVAFVIETSWDIIRDYGTETDLGTLKILLDSMNSVSEGARHQAGEISQDHRIRSDDHALVHIRKLQDKLNALAARVASSEGAVRAPISEAGETTVEDGFPWILVALAAGVGILVWSS